MSWNYNDMNEWIRRVRRGELPPLIITVAITGGVQGKEVNPYLPESPEEQAQQAYEAYKAGASIVHIHVRDPKTNYATPTADPAQIRLVNKKVRELCPDIIINNSTGIGLFTSLEERLKVLEADPEIASLNVGPVAWRTVLRKREPVRMQDVQVDLTWPPNFTWKEAEILAKRMLEKNIKPEFEVYQQGHFHVIYHLIENNLAKEPYIIQLVLGVPGGELPHYKNLINMMEHLPPNSFPFVIGIGPFQTYLTTMAIVMGLHVRVGLEDNVFYRRGELAKSNAQLVERVVRIANEVGRPVATPDEARKMLGLPKEPKQYD
ncbi:MAG: 3-keto-5-aminohexanoate cleavage protein [Candidatus Nezhaarchaeales archaeon]